MQRNTQRLKNRFRLPKATDLTMPFQIRKAPVVRGIRDKYLEQAVKVSGVNPQIVREIGPGAEPHHMSVLLRKFPKIKDYDLVERGFSGELEGGIPVFLADKLKKLKVQLKRADRKKINAFSGWYEALNVKPCDLILFNNVFGTTVPFPDFMLAKSILDVKQDGAIIIQTGLASLLAGFRGKSKSNLSKNAFNILKKAGFNLTFFEKTKQGTLRSFNFYQYNRNNRRFSGLEAKRQIFLIAKRHKKIPQDEEVEILMDEFVKVMDEPTFESCCQDPNFMRVFDNIDRIINRTIANG